LAHDRVESLETQMRIRLEGWSRRPFVEAIQGFKGFQLVSAMIVTSELGDLSRFAHPRQLMAYLGLVPSEHSSGGSRHQGSITKTGNSHVRWILVEIVHAYRLPPKVSTHLTVRQEKLDKAIKALSWKVQKRLHTRYVKLIMRRLHENKIKVAIAREMAAFVWELGRIMKENAVPKEAVA
jgi:transposase